MKIFLILLLLFGFSLNAIVVPQKKKQVKLMSVIRPDFIDRVSNIIKPYASGKVKLRVRWYEIAYKIPLKNKCIAVVRITNQVDTKYQFEAKLLQEDTQGLATLGGIVDYLEEEKLYKEVKQVMFDFNVMSGGNFFPRDKSKWPEELPPFKPFTR